VSSPPTRVEDARPRYATLATLRSQLRYPDAASAADDDAHRAALSDVGLGALGAELGAADRLALAERLLDWSGFLVYAATEGGESEPVGDARQCAPGGSPRRASC